MLNKSLWTDVMETVSNISFSENSYRVSNDTVFPDVDHFSDNGLSQLGTKLRFPSKFVRELVSDGHYDLAEEIISTKKADFFKNRQEGETPLLFRSFIDSDRERRVHGVLTDRYSIFDDIEVANALENSSYLMNAEEVWSDISPEHFHARFISSNKLSIPGDSSPLSMCVFVDNSMVGLSMLKIRFGIYRWACTNGMITGLKEFSIVRERHIGADKEWQEIVAYALSDARNYEDMLLSIITDMSVTKSSIYGMSDEDAVRYIKDKLSTSQKTASEVLLAYNNYGGYSKWDLCNAITDTAHKFENIDSRLLFEERALRVA